MQKRLKLVIAQPFADLLKYKTFFLLMLILAFADRGIKIVKSTYHLNIKIPPFWRVDPELSARVFFKYTDLIWKQVGGENLLLAAVGLLLVKNILWLWPSSDLRRMHRGERGRFAILGALRAIGWRSLAWNLAALLVWCGAIAAWCVACYYICRFGWQRLPNGGWLWGLGISVAMIIPLMLAGFSFASKLAVQAAGRPMEKLKLLFKIITAWRVTWRAWLFYLACFILEALFVTLTTAFILVKMTPGPPRILLAVVLAAPFHAYLEMASFKLFLVLYEKMPLIREEYDDFYGH